MSSRPIAIAFDVDPESLTTLRQAFPDWTIETVTGATSRSLTRDWDPGRAALLVVGAHDRLTQTLGLCRGLRSQAGRAQTPLLVLVTPAHEAEVKASLDAGADSCLVLPVHAKNLVSVVARAHAGNQPGRHTLGLDRAQRENLWQDSGGEA